MELFIFRYFHSSHSFSFRVFDNSAFNEDIPEDQDSEDEPLKPKKRKKIDQKSKVLRSSKSQAQLLAKYQNYVQIQEKYKNHLKITVPTLSNSSKTHVRFSDYQPLQPLETFWKPCRPPSRKKKEPKGYEKYPFACKSCPKKFTNDNLLSFHIKVYHNPHFQCPYCPNAFHQEEANKFKKHLFNHEHVTETDLPHECIQCGKQDFCLQRLQKHIDEFRGPFHNNQCTQCSEKFENHANYKDHVKKCHQGVWKYRCDECELIFDSIKASKEHRLEAHKRKQPPKHTLPTMCDICGKVLKGESHNTSQNDGFLGIS